MGGPPLHQVPVPLMSLQDWERGSRQNICTLKQVMFSDVIFDAGEALSCLSCYVRCTSPEVVAFGSGQKLLAAGEPGCGRALSLGCAPVCELGSWWGL